MVSIFLFFGGLWIRGPPSQALPILDVPKIKCSICGRETPAHEVYALPEVWRHARQMALYMLGKAPKPQPDEQALVRKYGYTIHDVFCCGCWLDLILDGGQKPRSICVWVRKDSLTMDFLCI